jgi:hypothetical protein
MTGRRRRPGRIRPGTVVDRVPALDPRHLVSRGQIQGQNPIRTQSHGCSPQPRDRALRLAGRIDVTEATRWAGAPWTAPSPSSNSHHDLGTAARAVVGGPTACCCWRSGPETTWGFGPPVYRLVSGSFAGGLVLLCDAGGDAPAVTDRDALAFRPGPDAAAAVDGVRLLQAGGGAGGHPRPVP